MPYGYIIIFSIGEASEAQGVSITTLRRWEAKGKLIPDALRDLSVGLVISRNLADDLADDKIPYD